MKKFEIIVGFIAVLGISLKIFHIVGGSILTVLALFTLSIFYYVFSFALFNDIRDIRLQDIFRKGAHKDTNAKGIKVFVQILWSWTIPMVLIGGLFKLQFWQGGNMPLLLGTLTIGFILLIATISKEDYYRRIFKRTLIYGVFGLVLYLTPLSTLVDVYYGNHPEYAELYKKVLADPNNLELRKQLEQMREEMQGATFYPELKKEPNKDNINEIDTLMINH